jgi:ABC-type uncharacterized transport system ATPase subunit
MTTSSPKLELIGVSKHYPGVKANDGIDLRVLPGEIHAILGENGAGKSTLMKVIYGAVKPDAGEIRWDGAKRTRFGPEEARSLGIAMVFQHFSLFDTLTIAENVWLGQPRSLGLPEVRAKMRGVMNEYGFELDPERPVFTLGVGERQRVEILRALLGRPKLLILDEPTSVLTPQAVLGLFAVVRKLAERGCSVLYISHKLDEVRALCHRCTILRRGRVTGEVDPSKETDASLSRLMIGQEPTRVKRIEKTPGLAALEVKGLSLSPRREERHGVALRNVSFSVRSGEIVGIAGVSGNGQAELLAALSGENPTTPPGTVVLGGEDVSRRSPAGRRMLGLHFVPEERLGRATVPSMSLARNTLLTRREPVGRAGYVRRNLAEALAARLIERFSVSAAGPGATAASLSGGNLQKFVVGREIDAGPKVLVVARPTWGVDVGAAARIRQALVSLRDGGAAVLIVSEDLEELFAVSNRLVVLSNGRLSPPLSVADATVERIGSLMSGLFDDASGDVARA